MRVKTIPRIKNFGVFKDYRFDSSAKPFNCNNLIFGWNYSGKTTLSRIFRSLETGEIPDDLQGGTFEVELQDGSIINADNLRDHGLRIRVFNADYVRDNLKWKEAEGDLPPIFVVGSKRIELQEKIDDLEKKNEELDRQWKALDEQALMKESKLKRQLSAKAKEITTELRLGNHFNRSHLERLLEDPDIESWELDEAEFYRYKEMALQGTEMDDLKPLVLTIRENLYAKTAQLLMQVVTPGKTLERLRLNSDVESWVRRGLELHSDQSSCLFCGKPLTPEVFAELHAHFSKDYEEFIVSLKEHLTQLENAKLQIAPYQKEQLYAEHREDYIAAQLALESVINDYNTTIEDFIHKTQEKLKKPTIPIDLERVSHIDVKAIDEALVNLNRIIQDHNKINADFEENQRRATELLKKHYAATFYREERYKEQIQEIVHLRDRVSNIKVQIEVHLQELEKHLAEVSEIMKGAEQLKYYMDLYFGGNSPLSIEVTDGQQFRLMRGDVQARNLSEGEQTAIVFSYFMASLHDREMENKLHETIVYIDDPVSSLDANHLYNTYSMISSYLKNKCAQLFVSTHNHEFFKLIKDEFKPWRHRELKCSFDKSGPESNMNCCAPIYVITRTGDRSVLTNVDCLLCHFNSEYYYIFKELSDYAKSEDDDNFRAYTFPNLLRRFLDIYMRFNHPAEVQSSLKLEPLIKDPFEAKFVKKVIDELSHNEVAERTMRFPEPHEIRKAIQITFRALQENRADYFEELIRVTHVSDDGLSEAAAGQSDT